MREHAMLAVGVYWSVAYKKRVSAAQEHYIAVRDRHSMQDLAR